MAEARIHQVAVETLVQPTDQQIQVHQVVTEVLIQPPANVQIHQVAVEVLILIAAPPTAGTKGRMVINS